MDRMGQHLVEDKGQYNATVEDETAAIKPPENVKDDLDIAIDIELAESMSRLNLGPPCFSDQYRPQVTIHCVRHGQAYHNLRGIIPKYRRIDPLLTPHGRQQAQNLQSSFPYMSKITHILVSPLTRTLDTTLLGFGPLIARGVKVLAWPDLREFGQGRCSTGSPLSDLKEQYEPLGIDFSLVTEDWEYEKDLPNEKRPERVRRELWELTKLMQDKFGGQWKGLEMSKMGDQVVDIHLLIVSHDGFLKNLCRAVRGYWNAQWRSYEFESDYDDDEGERLRRGRRRWDLIEVDREERTDEVLITHSAGWAIKSRGL